MKREKVIVSITIGIVCFLLAMITFMQFKVVQESQQANIDTMQEAELRQELANWKTKYDETKEKYDELALTLDSYKEESSTDSQTKQTLEEELKKQELILGKTDVEGEGAIITITEKQQNELAMDEEIISIGADDLIYIINSLKDAGAEAISVNDERIINTTDIADVGDSIKINSKYLRTTTYIIKVIGNGSYLESSIFGKGGYAEQLNTTGIKTIIDRENKVRILKYNGDFEKKYMEEAK